MCRSTQRESVKINPCSRPFSLPSTCDAPRNLLQYGTAVGRYVGNSPEMELLLKSHQTSRFSVDRGDGLQTGNCTLSWAKNSAKRRAERIRYIGRFSLRYRDHGHVYIPKYIQDPSIFQDRDACAI